MLGKFQPGLAIDCWTLVPDILKRGRRSPEAGPFVIRDQILEIGHGRRRSPSTSLYIADLFLPSDDQVPATGFLLLLHEAWEQAKLALLVGRPDGFGKYKWWAICPATLKPVQMLYFDAGTQLFVSRKAIGKPAPVSVQRAEKAKIEIRKYCEKYGSISDAILGDLKGGRNSVLIEAVVDIQFDALFALNGFPSPISHSGALDIFATIQNTNARDKLPEHLLAKNLQPAPKVYRTKEELIARLKRRGLPIHPVLLA